MENHTNETDKERLTEKVDNLTEENQRCFLGIVEALSFAQGTQNTIVPGFLEEKSPVAISMGIEKKD